jgi:hypothetical protein
MAWMVGCDPQTKNRVPIIIIAQSFLRRLVASPPIDPSCSSVYLTTARLISKRAATDQIVFSPFLCHISDTAFKPIAMLKNFLENA